MVDPVVASDGHSYERAAIQAIIDLAQPGGSACSPLTREGLGETLVPNINLRKRIREHDNEVESVAQQVLASVHGANALALASGGGGGSIGGGGGGGGWAAGAVAMPPAVARSASSSSAVVSAFSSAGAVVSTFSSSAAPPADCSETVAAVLASLNLHRYAKAFDDHGYDSWNELVFHFSEAQITKLAKTVGMASNHLDRLRTALEADRRNHTASSRALSASSAVDTSHTASSRALSASSAVDTSLASSWSPMEDGVVAGAAVDTSLATPMEDGVVAGAAPPTPGETAEAAHGSAQSVVAGAVPPTPGETAEAAHGSAQNDDTDAVAPKRGAVLGAVPEQAVLGAVLGAVPEQAVPPREGAAASGAAVGAAGVGLRTRDGRKRACVRLGHAARQQVHDHAARPQLGDHQAEQADQGGSCVPRRA